MAIVVLLDERLDVGAQVSEIPRAGLRNARAKGKKFGRPRVEIDAVRVAELRRNGFSWSQVWRTLNVSKGSAQRSVARLPKSNVLVGSTL